MNSLLESMAHDMNVYPYPSEDEKAYHARIVYSAMGYWLRMITLDNYEFSETEVSKVYFLKRGKELLNSFIAAFPDVEKWFLYDEDITIEKVIKDIREKMLFTGELISTESGKVGLPEEKKAPCTLGISRSFGVDKHNTRYFYSGLTKLVRTNDDSKPAVEHINCGDFIEWAYDSAVWTESNSLDSYEFFDSTVKKPMYQAWSNSVPHTDGRYLARIRLFHDLYEYWLVLVKNGECFVAPMSKILFEQREYRRIMLGLRSKVGNPMNAKFEVKGSMVLVALFCRLPSYEESILNAYGWPQKRYDDRYNYIFPVSIWDMILELLTDNLKIDFEED